MPAPKPAPDQTYTDQKVSQQVLAAHKPTHSEVETAPDQKYTDQKVSQQVISAHKPARPHPDPPTHYMQPGI